MKHYPKLLALLCLVVLSFGACSDSSTEPAVDKLEALTTGTWKVTSYTQGGFDFSAAGPHEMTFSKDSTSSMDGRTGKWEFTSNESKIVLDKGGFSEQVWDIVELTSSSLKLKYTTSISGVSIATEMSAVQK